MSGECEPSTSIYTIYQANGKGP